MDKKQDILTFHTPDLTTRQEIPVAGSPVKAGFPSPADDFLDSPLDLNRELVHNPASTFFVRVSGDSMAGDGIGDGDLLIVDRSIAPGDGCIAVCYIDGEFTVKRVRLEKGCAWLMPSNPRYRPIRVDAGNEFHLGHCPPCRQNLQITSLDVRTLRLQQLLRLLRAGYSGPILWGGPSSCCRTTTAASSPARTRPQALGIGMGQPFYQVRPLIEQGQVTVFSANFALYGDLSRRVMATPARWSRVSRSTRSTRPFFDLRGMAEPLDGFGRTIGRTIRRNVGIPVSIGIAPTKTLAKIASKLAKQYPRLDGCCYMHRPEDIDKVLRKFPLQDVWGIGRRYGRMFDRMGLRTARQFVDLPQEWVRARMGVAGLRTWSELQGWSASRSNRCRRASSRLPYHAASPRNPYTRGAGPHRGRIRLDVRRETRGEQSVCAEVQCYLYTNRHREDQPQRCETELRLLPEPTDSSPEIVRQARITLRQLFQPGYGYKKAGVILSRITPASELQGSLFSPLDRGKHARLMDVMDTVNKRLGKGKDCRCGAGYRTVSHEPGTPLTALYDRLEGAAGRKSRLIRRTAAVAEKAAIRVSSRRRYPSPPVGRFEPSLRSVMTSSLSPSFNSVLPRGTKYSPLRQTIMTSVFSGRTISLSVEPLSSMLSLTSTSVRADFMSSCILTSKADSRSS